MNNSLAELWGKVLADHQSDIAIAVHNKSITYAELNDRATAIAAAMCRIGVGTRDLVAIFHTKSFDSYAAMIACLRMGFIYTNLDFNSPSERLRKIIGVCKPRLVLLGAELGEENSRVVESLDLPTLRLQTIEKELNADLGQRGRPTLTWQTPAYVMFTSGSTGIPKGVTITHGGLLNLIDWAQDYFVLNGSDRVANLNPMFFDNSVFDFYSAIFSGSCLLPVGQELLRKPAKLLEYLQEAQCSVWFSVPSLIVYMLATKVIRSDSMRDLRVMIFGGEGFPKSELKKLHEIIGSRVRLVNVYGPTEGTCICSAHAITDVDFQDMGVLAPLGKINPNFEYAIVDSEGREVALGEKGELVLMGPNISLGYYNDPERTRQHFIQRPLETRFNEIGYMTGDIVAEKDGLLWFSGRSDNQVKHMGYRIELEEIEAAFQHMSGVIQAGVVYHRDNERYGSIVCFLQVESFVTEKSLRANLAGLLPEYMIPNRIIFLESLPKNANGKVDRKELLACIGQ